MKTEWEGAVPHNYSAETLFHVFNDYGKKIMVGGLEVIAYYQPWSSVLSDFESKLGQQGEGSLFKLIDELDSADLDDSLFYYFRVISNGSDTEIFCTDRKSFEILTVLSHKYGVGEMYYSRVMPEDFYDKIWGVGCTAIQERDKDL